MQADYFNGNPNTTGVDSGSAPNLTASYSATVLPTSVTPEPSTFALLTASCAAFVGTRSRKRQR